MKRALRFLGSIAMTFAQAVLGAGAASDPNRVNAPVISPDTTRARRPHDYRP